MTSHHLSEPDSASNSVASTPRSDHPPARWHQDDAAAAPRVRLMCSFGGRILPRPHDNQLRYVGGDTRIVAVHRSATFSALHSKLAKLGGASDVAVKYQLPNEDLDALISVTTDEDVENMMEEYDRLLLGSADGAERTPRLRVFLFPPGVGVGGGFGSILDGSGSKRDSWFLDVLNGGAGSLERGRSEASSIMSEVPDYLFGLDNNSDDPKPKPRWALDNVSDPGSPIPATSTPKYCSTSSAPSVSPSPNLPPVKTKPETSDTPGGPEESRDVPVEAQVHQQAGYAGNPIWQYVQEPGPVYYMPGPVHGSNIPVRPVSMPVQYFNQVPQVAGGQVPVGYNPPVQGVWSKPIHAGPVYMGGPPAGRPAVAGSYNYQASAAVMAVDPYEVPAGGELMRNPRVIPAYPAAAGLPPMGGEPQAIISSEMRVARASQ